MSNVPQGSLFHYAVLALGKANDRYANANLDSGRWDEPFVEFKHGKASGIPNFVAKFTIALHTINIQVDITSYTTSDWNVEVRKRRDLPPEEYAHKANRRASVPHCGIPLG